MEHFEPFAPALPGLPMGSSRKGRSVSEPFELTPVNFTSYSDQTLKNNIQDIDKTDWDRLIRVKPRKFRWKDQPDREVYGFIAQEIQPIYPQMVNKSGKLLTVDYQQMVPLLVDRVNTMGKQVQPNQLCIEGTCVTQKDLIALKNLA